MFIIGHKIINFRSDSKEIMVHGSVEEYLASNGVIQQLSLPYEHPQNLVERHVQIVVKAVTAVMHDQLSYILGLCTLPRDSNPK
jgi:hypothetical protein